MGYCRKVLTVRHDGSAEISAACVLSPSHMVLPDIFLAALCSSMYAFYFSSARVCVCVSLGMPACGSESAAGVWGKTQQEAENPCCLWISVSKQEVSQLRHTCTLQKSGPCRISHPSFYPGRDYDQTAPYPAQFSSLKFCLKLMCGFDQMIRLMAAVSIISSFQIFISHPRLEIARLNITFVAFGSGNIVVMRWCCHWPGKVQLCSADCDITKGLIVWVAH